MWVAGAAGRGAELLCGMKAQCTVVAGVCRQPAANPVRGPGHKEDCAVLLEQAMRRALRPAALETF